MENSFSSISTSASFCYSNIADNYNKNKIKEENQSRKALLLQSKAERIQILN